MIGRRSAARDPAGLLAIGGCALVLLGLWLSFGPGGAAIGAGLGMFFLAWCAL